MFTPQPQRRGWSLTPRDPGKTGSTPSSHAGSDGGGGLLGKGEGVVVSEVPTPVPLPRGSRRENRNEKADDGGNGEVWKRFQEAGLSDEASLEKKDREAFVQRIAKLETELYDYQYNMGLLLIEKKEWTSKHEELSQEKKELSSKYQELRQGFTEAEEVLKRREDNLNKALGVEKQCVNDLEKALSDMRAEYAEIKFTSDQKLAEAHALMASIEEKSLEVEAKLRSADAKLAEASRKNSEIERKLLGIASRESFAQRELVSLNAEKELITDDLGHQREDLRTWERNLRVGQERLVESQSLLNQREKRSNELDKALKLKEKELEVAQGTVEKSKHSLKEEVDDVNARLTALVAKEQDINVKKANLERKEKDLIAREGQLHAREKVEIEKLLDDHKAVLDSKRHEFEMEMEKQRCSLDEELKDKLAAAEKTADEINQKEGKIVKRDQGLEKKMEKLKDVQRDLDVKSGALKKWEATIKANEKELEKKSKQLAEENHKLLISKGKLETERAVVDAEKQYLATEKENLKITEAERAEHVLLLSKLKLEIDECRIHRESLEKESENLRKERESFEREWDVLDEKRANLMADLKQFNGERESFEKWVHGEEEKLKREQHATRDLIQKDLDDLSLKKEHFERTMLQERSEAYEILERERADAARMLDLQKHELEIGMQKKLDEMEKEFNKRVVEFNDQRKKELENIKSLRENTILEIQKLSMEQKRFESEKLEFADQKNKLEEDRLEIQNDIETLHTLSKNLKVQQEQFIKEREYFLALVDQHKTCKNCGVTITGLVFTGMRQSNKIEGPGDILLPSLVEGYLEECLKVKKTDLSHMLESSRSGTSGGRMSWLRSCTEKIFRFSPVKRIEDSAESRPWNHGVLISKGKDEAEPSFGVAANSFDVERVQSGNEVRVTETSEKLDKESEGVEPSVGVGNASTIAPAMGTDSGIRVIEDEPVSTSTDGQGEVEGLSSLHEEESQLHVAKRKVGRTANRGKQIIRTRSVQAVVEDAQAFLKETSDKTVPANVDTKHSLDDVEDSKGDSLDADETNVGQKRRLGQMSATKSGDVEVGESEVRSESVSLSGRRKRRQTAVTGAQTPGERRYNFRRSTVANTAASSRVPSGHTRGSKPTNRPPSPDSEASKGVLEEEWTQKSAMDPSELDVSSRQKLVSRSREETHTEIHTGERETNLELDDSSGDAGKDTEAEINRMLLDEEEEEEEYGSDCSEGSSDSEVHDASIGAKFWRFFTS